MTTRLALMRHGRTAWNRTHRIQGRTDVPLDDEARRELSGLALCPPWDRAELWSSPLSRARDTAVLVAGRAPCISDALLEMDWGEWEGQRGADLLASPDSGFRHIENWGWDFAPPNGESPKDIRIRLENWLAELSGDNVAVCHIGVMRVALAVAWDWDFAGPCPFTIKRNRLYVMERRSGVWHAQPDPVRLAEVRP